MMHRFILLFCFITVLSCNKEEFQLSSDADDFFFLRHEGADMPVWVEGNTRSNVFLLLLHGGPGGSAFIINDLIKPFTNPLEERYGMVYWEQRGSGSSQGQFSAEKLRTEQFVEDLERLVFLLKDKYGAEIQLFLIGSSWGGYLGSSYLAKGTNQNGIRGWINIVGAHDFKGLANAGRTKLLFYADQQLALENNESSWTTIQEWCQENEVIESKEDFIEVNRFAGNAEILLEDSLDMEIGPALFSEQLDFIFSSPYNANAGLSNSLGIRSSQMIDILLKENLKDELPAITLPSLYITGRFDFIVPMEMVQEQYDLIQSEEKELHILQRSGHGCLTQETQKVLNLIIDFVERHR